MQAFDLWGWLFVENDMRFGFLVMVGFLTMCGACANGQTQMNTAVFVGAYTWEHDDKRFGGFSGVEMSGPGEQFVALSDWGHLVHGELQRDQGRITDVVIQSWQDLVRHDGKRLDSEGLAQAADGTVIVSIEGLNSVARLGILGGATILPQEATFDDFSENGGLESLAIDAQGRIYTLPESTSFHAKEFPVWRFDDKNWTQFGTITRDSGFLPVGADFGPDGKFYLLERQFVGLAYRTRIRRFTLDADAFHNAETILVTPFGSYGNLEGLSVWRDDTGHIRLTMLSDDNYSDHFPTEWVEYRLP